LRERYAGWQRPGAQAMLTSDLATIQTRVLDEALAPEPRSGRQEILESYVNRFV
jgi:xylose isomerase